MLGFAELEDPCGGELQEILTLVRLGWAETNELTQCQKLTSRGALAPASTSVEISARIAAIPPGSPGCKARRDAFIHLRIGIVPVWSDHCGAGFGP